MSRFFNGNRPRRENKCHNSRPIMFRGKYWLARELAMLPECELSEVTVRSRLTELEKLIESGDETLSDEIVMTCFKKRQRVKKNKRAKQPKKATIEDWNLLDSLWK